MEAAPGQGAMGEFLGDLGLALRVWAKAPLLPLVSVVVLSCWFFRPNAAALIGATVVGIVSLGFYGTQRIWYLRAFRGETLAPHEVVADTIAFIGPFLALGLILFLVSVPLLIVAGVLDALGVEWALACGVMTIPVDIVATFMTPALAYSTRDAGDAFRDGWRMLRREWPRSALYALTPPLAIAAVVQALPDSSIGSGARVAFGAGTVLLALWFKGATAAFYLRRHPEVGDYGSLREPRAAAASSPG